MINDTTANEDPPTYHPCDECGRKIQGEIPTEHRPLCHECAKRAGLLGDDTDNDHRPCP